MFLLISNEEWWYITTMPPPPQPLYEFPSIKALWKQFIQFISLSECKWPRGICHHYGCGSSTIYNWIKSTCNYYEDTSLLNYLTHIHSGFNLCPWGNNKITLILSCLGLRILLISKEEWLLITTNLRSPPLWNSQLQGSVKTYHTIFSPSLNVNDPRV